MKILLFIGLIFAQDIESENIRGLDKKNFKVAIRSGITLV